LKKRILLLLAGLVILLGGLVLVAVVIGQATPADDPLDTGVENAFPALHGTNLKFERIRIPEDLAEGLKLIVVAYDSDQQIYVDKWLRPLEKLNEDYPQLSGYYVPLLPQDTSDAAVAILGGMTIAARGDRDRVRTIVVFTNVDAFNEIVGVSSGNDVQLFLLDEKNRIRWRGSGAYQYETLQSLEQRLAELTGSARLNPS
jgi:hypothetical protein